MPVTRPVLKENMKYMSPNCNYQTYFLLIRFNLYGFLITKMFFFYLNFIYIIFIVLFYLYLFLVITYCLEFIAGAIR